MNNCAHIRRSITLGDEVRVGRYTRAPELGPRLLFFSGGTALRELSRRLKHYTHNSIHLITPFDSGGSSAVIRKAFQMLSVGDLRNRLMALADESQRGNRQIYRLFSHRFPVSLNEATARAEINREGREPSAEHLAEMELRNLPVTLRSMSEGCHPLVASVPEPLRRIVRTHLRVFTEYMPRDFDLRGASIGNLILAAGFLDNERDIDSVVFLFSKLVEVRGTVRPTVSDNLHLAATLEDGSRIIGQHLLTGKQASAIAHPVRDLSLVKSLDDPQPATCAINDKIRGLVTGADLIVFPMGSFFSSLIANLLPVGIGKAVRDAECPKVYVPNTGTDPEEKGLGLARKVGFLLEYLRRDAGKDVPVERLLNAVILDTATREKCRQSDLEEIRDRGIQVLDTPLSGERGNQPGLDADLLARALVSLG